MVEARIEYYKVISKPESLSKHIRHLSGRLVEVLVREETYFVIKDPSDKRKTWNIARKCLIPIHEIVSIDGEQYKALIDLAKVIENGLKQDFANTELGVMCEHHMKRLRL